MRRFELPERIREATERTILALLGLWALYHLAHLLAFHYGRDQAIYAVVARAMTEGGAPYRDAWDFKPPGIYLLYWLARVLFGDGVHAIRVLEALAMLSMGIAFGLYSKRHLDSWRPGLFGGVLAIVTHVQLEFWHTAQPESFGAVFVAWALVLVTLVPQRRNHRLVAWLGAGTLYGVAALLKPPLGGGIAASAAFLVWPDLRRGSVSERLRRSAVPLAVLALGFALPFLLTGFYFAAAGALGDLYETLFVFTPRYTQLSFERGSPAAFLVRAFVEWAFLFSAFPVPGLLLALALVPLTDRERIGLAQLCAVLAVEILGIALQGKFFEYHYAGALSLGCLIAGWGLYKLWLRCRPRLPLVAAFSALVVALFFLRSTPRAFSISFEERCQLRLSAFLDSSVRQEINDELYTVYDVNARDNRLAAEWIRANTPEDARIFVWGFQPVIYELSDRRPASRYIYNVAQRVSWGQEDARTRLVEELKRSSPAAFLVERGDRLRHVTGDELDSAGSLVTFPELLGLIREGYRPAVRLGRFDILLRR